MVIKLRSHDPKGHQEVEWKTYHIRSAMQNLTATNSINSKYFVKALLFKNFLKQLLVCNLQGCIIQLNSSNSIYQNFPSETLHYTACKLVNLIIYSGSSPAPHKPSAYFSSASHESYSANSVSRASCPGRAAHPAH